MGVATKTAESPFLPEQYRALEGLLPQEAKALARDGYPILILRGLIPCDEDIINISSTVINRGELGVILEGKMYSVPQKKVKRKERGRLKPRAEVAVKQVNIDPVALLTYGPNAGHDFVERERLYGFTPEQSYSFLERVFLGNEILAHEFRQHMAQVIDMQEESIGQLRDYFIQLDEGQAWAVLEKAVGDLNRQPSEAVMQLRRKHGWVIQTVTEQWLFQNDKQNTDSMLFPKPIGLDISPRDGAMRIVMERINGGITLRDLISSGEAISPEVIFEVMSRICLCLERLHASGPYRRGISHGDLNPGNIIITGDLRTGMRLRVVFLDPAFAEGKKPAEGPVGMRDIARAGELLDILLEKYYKRPLGQLRNELVASPWNVGLLQFIEATMNIIRRATDRRYPDAFTTAAQMMDAIIEAERLIPRAR